MAKDSLEPHNQSKGRLEDRVTELVSQTVEARRNGERAGPLAKAVAAALANKALDDGVAQDELEKAFALRDWAKVEEVCDRQEAEIAYRRLPVGLDPGIPGLNLDHRGLERSAQDLASKIVSFLLGDRSRIYLLVLSHYKRVCSDCGNMLKDPQKISRLVADVLGKGATPEALRDAEEYLNKFELSYFNHMPKELVLRLLESDKGLFVRRVMLCSEMTEAPTIEVAGESHVLWY